jgi:hypothetical protein
MKLPNAIDLVVEREKIVDHLLNLAHPMGASKARFFISFGFTAGDWHMLAVALREHGQNDEISRTRQTGFGPRFEVEGGLATPDGRRPRVRSVWQFDSGASAPRLITAHPLETLP